MSSLPDEVRQRLTDLAGVLDEVVAQTCDELIEESDWSDWEVTQAVDDLFNLSRSADCAYDRPSIGVSYALWYQGRRTHDVLRALIPLVTDEQAEFDAIDIGCGTGATACALMLLNAALPNSVGPDTFTLHCVDSSPFMVLTAQRIVDALRRRLDHLMTRPMEVTFEVASWTDIQARDTRNSLMVGGYLLDQSDYGRVDDVSRRLARFGDRFDISHAVMLTTNHKRSTLKAIAESMEQEGWLLEEATTRVDPLWEGSMGHSHAVRQDWYSAKGIDRSVFNQPPSWNNRTQPMLVNLIRNGRSSDRLFELERSGLILDDEQDEASTPEARLTVVVGAAGSGKSRVLAERVVRTIETSDPAVTPVILVTAFNKAMIDQLAEWVINRMQESGAISDTRRTLQREGWHALSCREKGREVEVVLMNRDRLPHRVFGQAWPGPAPNWKDSVGRRLSIYEANTLAPLNGARYLSPEFLEAELEQVIYGRWAADWAIYGDTTLAATRRGRMVGLGVEQRERVWKVLMDPPRPDGFVYRRLTAFEAHIDAVKEEEPLRLERDWTHVFVDECQDFTESDIRLLACVPPDPNHLFITGDEQQSMHLGRTYHRPGLRKRQWKKHELEGSYRLPVRVCEALEQLALDFIAMHDGDPDDNIDLVLPEARKSAVLGPRPIVVAGNESSVQDELLSIVAAYERFWACDGQTPRISVVEGERSVTGLLTAAVPAVEIEPANMLRIKGLERSCVVFSDRASIPEDRPVAQWIYTALTRSNSLLILVLWPDGDPATKAMIGRLRKDRLLFWSARAGHEFEEATKFIGEEQDPMNSHLAVHGPA